MKYLLAHRYAQALYEISKSGNNTEQIHSDLKNLLQIISESNHFADFIHNPVIHFKKRREILSKLFQGKFDAMTNRFLGFIATKDRLAILQEICIAYGDIYLKENDIVRAKITTSVELSKHQISALEQHLKLRLRKEIESDIVVDPNLIGGIKVQVGDFVQDFSIRSQLDQFRKNLLKEQ